MPFTVLLFVYRLPSISPTDFKTHYENIHVPLIQSIAGDTFPKSHTRHYIQRNNPSAADLNQQSTTYPASVLIGEQTDFEYDAIAHLLFEDEAAFLRFSAVFGTEEAKRKIAEDEKGFADSGRMKAVVVGESEVTGSRTE